MKRAYSSDPVKLLGLALVVDVHERPKISAAIAELHLEGEWVVSGTTVETYREGSGTASSADLWTWLAADEKDASRLQAWMDSRSD